MSLLDGRYQLVRSLGVGGMGEVWLARHLGPEGFQKLVAVKIAHPALAASESFRALFVEEAKLAARMRHPNVAQIYELGVSGDRYFIVMEYVGGASLRRLIDRAAEHKKPMGVAVACFITTQLLRGLHYVHQLADETGRPLSLVHRDVSPANCLVSMEGEVKLIDFGIAKGARAEATGPGWVKGKVAYMSPEQLAGLPLDGRTDVYSAALVLYELLAGERAFPGDSDSEIAPRVQRAEIRSPLEHRPELPAPLVEVLLQALARHPEDRPKSALALAEALLPFVGEGEGSSTADLARHLSQEIVPPAVPPAPPELSGGPERTLEVDIEVVESREADAPARSWGLWLALTLLLAPVVLGVLGWTVLRWMLR